VGVPTQWLKDAEREKEKSER